MSSLVCTILPGTCQIEVLGSYAQWIQAFNWLLVGGMTEQVSGFIVLSMWLFYFVESTFSALMNMFYSGFYGAEQKLLMDIDYFPYLN